MVAKGRRLSPASGEDKEANAGFHLELKTSELEDGRRQQQRATCAKEEAQCHLKVSGQKEAVLKVCGVFVGLPLHSNRLAKMNQYMVSQSDQLDTILTRRDNEVDGFVALAGSSGRSLEPHAKGTDCLTAPAAASAGAPGP
jgi:hypothetical protein